MLEVERKRHMYIETERLKNLMIEKNEVAWELDEIIAPDLAIDGLPNLT